MHKDSATELVSSVNKINYTKSRTIQICFEIKPYDLSLITLKLIWYQSTFYIGQLQTGIPSKEKHFFKKNLYKVLVMFTTNYHQARHGKRDGQWISHRIKWTFKFSFYQTLDVQWYILRK